MKYCPKHYTPEGSNVDRCNGGDFGIPCPEMVEEDATKTVNLKCGPCDLHVIVPVPDLVSGKAQRELPRCSRDECACVVLPAEGEADSPTAQDYFNRAQRAEQELEEVKAGMAEAIEAGVKAAAKAKATKAAKAKAEDTPTE